MRHTGRGATPLPHVTALPHAPHHTLSTRARLRRSPGRSREPVPSVLKAESQTTVECAPERWKTIHLRIFFVGQIFDASEQAEKIAYSVLTREAQHGVIFQVNIRCAEVFVLPGVHPHALQSALEPLTPTLRHRP